MHDVFGLNSDQIQMRESVLDLLERHLSPEKVRSLEDSGDFPEEAYQALADAGWLGLIFDDSYGGAGGSYTDLAVVMEAMGYHWTGISHAVLASVGLAGVHIATYGNSHQKQLYLPEIVSGKSKMAFALTEPSAGSDAASIRTRAEKKGDGFLLNGSKLYITCGYVADFLVVAVKTDPDAGKNGISMLLVDAKSDGVSIRRLKQLGRHCTATSEIFFDNVKVPAENLMGPENGGWPNLLRCLGVERLILAATYTGNSFRIIDYAKDYATKREQFGRPVTKFQAVAHKFADMRIMAETARLHAFDVAHRLDAGVDASLQIAIAKVVAAENNFRVANLGMQVMGGAAYMMEYEMQRYFRDARIGSIGGGTSEIQRNIIAKQVGL